MEHAENDADDEYYSNNNATGNGTVYDAVADGT